MATEFDASKPPAGLSRDQVATLLAEQKRLASTTPLPVKREQQIAALQATQKAAVSSEKSRSSRGANTSFSGLGTDTVLAQDIYDVKESTALNSVFESAKGGAKDSVKYLTANKASSRDLLNTALELKSGRIDSVSALGRLGVGLNSGTFLKIKNGAGGLLDKVGSGLGVSPDITNQIKIGVGGAFSYILNNDVTQPQDTFDLMKSLLGEPELLQFFDIEAETTLLTGMFDNAVEYGMYDLIDYTKQSGRYDDRSFNYAVLGTSYTAINSGDIDAIEMMLTHVSAEDVLGQNPAVIKDLLRSYTLRPNVTPDQYPGKLTQLKNVFEKLNPNWYQSRLNGEWVSNYDIMSTIGDDATKLLSMDPVLRDIVLVAPFYTEKSPIIMGVSMYPGSAIGAVR
jgi:hypothetical protein